MSIIDWIADVLPQVEEAALRNESEWQSTMSSLDAKAPSAEARESLRAVARSVRALHEPGALDAVSMPIDGRSARMLEEVRSTALEELETEWGSALRSSITPVEVPALPADGSLDFAGQREASRQESPRNAEFAELVARELGTPQQPPGWLWARVREDVRTERQGVLRFRRNRRVVRWATAAALLVITASVWPLVAGPLFSDGDDAEPRFDIQIISVDRPLDAASSPLAILRSARDGR